MAMDAHLITNLFNHTLEPSPEVRAQAEKQLTQLSTCPGFLPVLLQMVMSQEVAVAVRQAAVIYLKNMIGKHWRERDPLITQNEKIYIIPDADKAFVKEKIVESIISATDIIRVQLTVSIYEILSCDFPDKWPDIVHKLVAYLSTDDKNTWAGTLLVLYQIVKKYEFKRKEERGPIEEVMKMFLPMLQSRCISLLKDESAESFHIITKVFKIFRALIQLHLPLNLINQNNFPQWMGLFKSVLEMKVPQSTLEVDEDDRPQLPWWKAKKWAVTVLYKVFERYGCPGSEETQYNQFADFYDKHFSETGDITGVLNNGQVPDQRTTWQFKIIEQVTGIMLATLDAHRRKEYISPRVLQQTINYLTQGVSNARSWKLVKPHFQEIFKEILFPLMCQSEEDEALWHDDPQEYIRIKYDIFEDFLYFSPNAAAKAYLKEAVKKRRNVLTQVVEFVNQILNTDNSQLNPKHKDGALHVIGSLAQSLVKKKAYKSHMEPLLSAKVLPEIQSPFGFLRARACWVIQQFAIIEFKNGNVLGQTLHAVLQCLTDKELPVQVEAGIAIRQLLEDQSEKANDFLRPHVKGLVQQILRILRESENDELTGTISKLVQNFTEEVSSISLELVQTLTETFHNLVESEEDYDSKSVTAMGILETIEIIVGELDGAPEVMIQLEQQVVGLIRSVLQKELMEYYEEVFSLINECTTVQVSQVMWSMLFLLYETFQQDTADYFTEMMPCLHNYVTVDPQAFLGEPKYCEVIFNMCKQMLMEYSGEGAQCQAAKLLEVLVLQYRGEIDRWLPVIVSLALERLSIDVKISELRVMLLQIIIASLINNPLITLQHLEKVQTAELPQGMVAHFLSQWLKDTDCFLGMHDRKVYVLGICALLSLPANHRPDAVTIFAPQFLPALIHVFDGLNGLYDRMQRDVEEEENGDTDEEELNDSDDEYDEEGRQYVEKLQKKSDGKEFDFEDDDFASELDMFVTPIDDNPYIDEFISFKTCFQEIQNSDPQTFAMMTQALTEEQKASVQEVINQAIQKQQKIESLNLEKQGGYNFEVTKLPTNFQFGGSLS